MPAGPSGAVGVTVCVTRVMVVVQSDVDGGRERARGRGRPPLSDVTRTHATDDGRGGLCVNPEELAERLKELIESEGHARVFQKYMTL